ncbi:uncharacterized protein [Antedon mediterranea]|uniref:uncharacterized protein n=1 Tax=Antedon mediterranea TaxID=105859 RepID=UPI003AF9ED4B
MAQNGPVIIIIGAGLAGLSAARMLNQSLPDSKVTILEALSRPGGRVKSWEIGENEFIECGATWIHGVKNNPILGLIRKQKRKNFNTLVKYAKVNGEEVSKEIVELFERIYLKLRDEAEFLYYNNKPLNGIQSVGEFLEKGFQREIKDRKLSIDCEEMANSIFHYKSLLECCISGCNSLLDLDLQDFGEYRALGGGDLRVQGGYVQAVDRLLESLPKNSVVYNSPVKEVHWKDVKNNNGASKPVAILCENGDQYYADHVIATQSLGHLKENSKTLFKPTLPKVKVDAIDRMGFNYITKIFLRYKTPFWTNRFTRLYLLWDRVHEVETETETSMKETWYRKIFEFAVHPLVSNTLVVWLSGESALHAESLEDDVISTKCTDLLRDFLQDPSIPEPCEVLKTSWNTNPYFRGAYSYVAVGSGGEDCDRLAEPLYVENTKGVDIARVFFSGEATHRTFYSTAHGAFLSGERVAKQLASLYHKMEGEMNNIPSQIIVIGSGIAGLSAALKLTECLPDCKVTILEALSRPGGRIHSIQLSDNEYLEKGATFLHSTKNNPVKELFTRHTELTDGDATDGDATDGDAFNHLPKYWKTNGDEVLPETFIFFKRLFQRILYKEAASLCHNKSTNGQRKNDAISVGQFLQQQFLLELRKLGLTTEDENTASSIFQVLSFDECCHCGCSSLYELLLADYGEYDEMKDHDMVVRGGYLQVIEEMLKQLPKDCVIYNTPVIEIKWENDDPTVDDSISKGSSKRVTVLCKDGKQYYADHVITTQSLGHLKKYATTLFKPALPQIKYDVINRMGFSYITKIHLRYENSFWKDIFTSVTPLWDRIPGNAVNRIDELTAGTWYRKIFEFAVHPLVSNTLVVWLSGESALHAESLEDDVISTKCTDLLRELLKDSSIPEPIEVLTTSWNTNPYFRGAYSYVAVGSSGKDFDRLAEPLYVTNSEGVTIPRVLFAGEATHRTLYSTTQGALLSGQREAERLVSLYTTSEVVCAT